MRKIKLDEHLGKMLLKKTSESTRQLFFQTLILDEVIKRYDEKGIVLVPREYEEAIIKVGRSENLIKVIMKSTVDKINHVRLMYCNEVELTLYEERILLGQFLKKDCLNTRLIMKLLLLGDRLIKSFQTDFKAIENKYRKDILHLLDFNDAELEKIKVLLNEYYSKLLNVKKSNVKEISLVVTLLIETLTLYEAEERKITLKSLKKKYSYKKVLETIEIIKKLESKKDLERGIEIIMDFLKMIFKRNSISKDLLQPLYDEVVEKYLDRKPELKNAKPGLIRTIKKKNYLKENRNKSLQYLTLER